MCSADFFESALLLSITTGTVAPKEKMNSKILNIFVIGSGFVLSACSSVQLFPPSVPCPNCAAATQINYAVTRPMICNDYPVSYRVLTPDVSGKVHPINTALITNAPANIHTLTQNQSCGK